MLLVKSFLNVAIVATAPLTSCTGFSRVAFAMRHAAVSRLRSATAATTTDLDKPTNCGDVAIHPLGPPSFLTNLPVGETFCLLYPNMNITRLSSSPDVFLVRNFISLEGRETLMRHSALRGMKVAGTRRSGENTIRKNSYLKWIDPYGIDDGGGIGGAHRHREAASVAREMIARSRLCFSHEVMNGLMNDVRMLEEQDDLQVAKYDAEGRFDCHHDGYGRYLTALTYLNGVGGTYFPFGGMDGEFNGTNFTNESEVRAAYGMRDGQCGILIAGKEGTNFYLESTSVIPKITVIIQEGDAIAFYSYGPDGEKDLRSLHCGLTVPEEKWIATCWFRSEALTGPFRSWKIPRLVEEWMGHCKHG